MKRAMIDLETLGTSKSACVIQIGAAYFDADSGQVTETFKCNVDAHSAARNGAVLDAGATYFWLQQSEQARQSVVAEPRILEFDAFTQLNDFLADADEIWSHATFDFVIVMEALRRLDIKPKFSYRAARDIRTLVALSPTDTKLPRDGVHHDALDDCKYQVAYCCRAINSLKGK